MIGSGWCNGSISPSLCECFVCIGVEKERFESLPEHKSQQVTCGILNCQCSAYSSGTAHIKSSCNLIGKCFVIGN